MTRIEKNLADMALWLLAHATHVDQEEHIYEGGCPDEKDPHARDLNCRACLLLIAAQHGYLTDDDESPS